MADYGQEQIIHILMERDKISRGEAEDIVNETQYVINDALDIGASYDDIADIIDDYLGLEMDYIFAFL